MKRGDKVRVFIVIAVLILIILVIIFSYIKITGNAVVSSIYIDRISLIDADRDIVIQGYENLQDGMTVNLASLPTRNITIAAFTVGNVKSVIFGLDDNQNYKYEGSAPYSISGDDGANYRPWNVPLGTHTLNVTPYATFTTSGDRGASKTIRITFVNSINIDLICRAASKIYKEGWYLNGQLLREDSCSCESICRNTPQEGWYSSCDNSLIVLDNCDNQNVQCSDGIDNDNDGFIDYLADPGCSSVDDNDEYNAPLPTGDVTIITINDNKIVRNNVNRLGINLGGVSSGGSSVHLMKNILRNPGFENGEMRSVILINKLVDGNKIYQTNLNSSSSSSKQPEDFWNGADYEIVEGPAKGNSGRIVDFYHDFNNNPPRPVFVLDKSIPTPNSYDVMYVRKTFSSEYMPTIGVERFAGWDKQGSVVSDSSTKRPNSAGGQSVRMEAAGGTMEHYLDRSHTTNDKSSGKALIVEGNWKISFWAKAKNNGDKIKVEFRRNSQTAFISRTIELTTSWELYQLDFNVPIGIDKKGLPDPSNLQSATFFFTTSGRGNKDSVWIDDAFLGINNENNPSDFSDVVYQRLQELKPGVIRGWARQLGSNIEDETDDLYGRKSHNYFIGSKNPSDFSDYGIHELLELADSLDARPWIIVPPSITQQEASDLIDYLAGSSSTTYGAKRATRGRNAPWTDRFDTIYVEFGNELWGSGAPSDPFGGGSVRGGSRLGRVADRTFESMRGNPNFNSKIKLVIGGQVSEESTERDIQQNSNSHDAVALAPYFAGTITDFDDNEEIYGSLYAQAKKSSETGSMSKSVAEILKYNQNTIPLVYEINFHTTDTGPYPPIDKRNEIITGLGGGMALSYYMLNYMKLLGVRDQAAFTLLQYSFTPNFGRFYVRLWGILRDTDNLGTKRPSWLGMEIVNRGIFGNMIETIQSGDNPKWMQQPANSISTPRDEYYIHSFAFRDGNRNSIVIYNLDRTQKRDVYLNLSRNPTSIATRYVLNASRITDNNEAGDNVKIHTALIVDFSRQNLISLDPHSINVIVWTS